MRKRSHESLLGNFKTPFVIYTTASIYITVKTNQFNIFSLVECQIMAKWIQISYYFVDIEFKRNLTELRYESLTKCTLEKQIVTAMFFVYFQHNLRISTMFDPTIWFLVNF